MPVKDVRQMVWTRVSAPAKLHVVPHNDDPSAILSKLIQSKGWTVAELSHESRLSTKTIERILTRKTTEPRRPTREALGRALGVDESVFAGDRPDYQPQSPTQQALARIEGKLDDLLSRLPESDPGEELERELQDAVLEREQRDADSGASAPYQHRRRRAQ